ncbi:hypothetical protein [Hymenobacter rigui]|uniref:hypothetical protein n=1 Tax=Hymenobacter rigui TaxID=334424 RepID=UPI0011CF5EE2|nr:hypothetical protein [Hymenobacter rigui]
MLLLDESNVLRGIGAIGAALKYLGYALLAAVTYLGLRLLWRPVRRSDGSLEWGTNVGRWLSGLLLLTPATLLLTGWLWPEWYSRRADKAYSARQRAQQLRLVGDYALDPTMSDSCLRRATFTLSLYADSTFRAQADLPEFASDSLISGRWSLNTDHSPRLIVTLEPSWSNVRAYPLYTDAIATIPYLEASTDLPGKPSSYRLRLAKRHATDR